MCVRMRTRERVCVCVKGPIKPPLQYLDQMFVIAEDETSFGWNQMFLIRCLNKDRRKEKLKEKEKNF